MPQLIQHQKCCFDPHVYHVAAVVIGLQTPVVSFNQMVGCDAVYKHLLIIDKPIIGAEFHGKSVTNLLKVPCRYS